MPRLIRIFALLAFSIGCGCKQSADLSDRLKAAGGAEALKIECLGFVTAFEQSSGNHRNWFAGQTNFPPTIAALRPRVVQVGKQGDVVLVHLGFVGEPPPYGLYVAPRGCPSNFLPKRPRGSKITKLGEGVFEYAD